MDHSDPISGPRYKRASQPPRKANDAGMNGRRKKHLDLQVAEGAEKRSDAVSNKNGGIPWEFHGNSMGIPWEFHGNSMGIPAHLQNGSMMFHGSVEKLSAQPVSWHSDPSLSCLQAQEIIVKSGEKTQSGMERRKRRRHKYHINNQQSLYIPLISLNYLTYSQRKFRGRNFRVTDF